MYKSLKDISWDVTEEQYRADPALSYSTLARYEREGFDKLDHLFDKISTPALTHGSIVDCLITGDAEEFNERFLVANYNVSDSGKEIYNVLAPLTADFAAFNDIPEETVSFAAQQSGFWKDPKWDKRRYLETIKTGLPEYYDIMKQSEGKTVISAEEYQDAMNCVEALRTSPATSVMFAPNNPSSPLQRFYQLKFKVSNQGVNYRVMADLIIVNYETKKIYPIDLKTSGKPEWHFEDSFMQWNYMIQAQLYARAIKSNMMADEYFKDFELMPYRFVVVNKYTLTPLVWNFPHTFKYGTLVDNSGNEYRDPYVIGAELQKYLNMRPRVPEGINLDSVNEINCLKPKS